MDKNNPVIYIGINGFGSIGMIVYHLLAKGVYHECKQVTKINDLMSKGSLECFLQHDSTQGRKDLSLQENGEDAL